MPSPGRNGIPGLAPQLRPVPLEQPGAERIGQPVAEQDEDQLLSEPAAFAGDRLEVRREQWSTPAPRGLQTIVQGPRRSAGSASRDPERAGPRRPAGIDDAVRRLPHLPGEPDSSGPTHGATGSAAGGGDGAGASGGGAGRRFTRIGGGVLVVPMLMVGSPLSSLGAVHADRGQLFHGQGVRPFLKHSGQSQSLHSASGFGSSTHSLEVRFKRCRQTTIIGAIARLCIGSALVDLLT